jgi:hypothetical protein
MREVLLTLLVCLAGCYRTDHTSLTVTHIEVEVHGECARPLCSMEVLGATPLKSVSSSFEGSAYRNEAGQWVVSNCGVYPSALAQYHVTRHNPDGGAEEWSGWAHFQGQNDTAEIWAAYSDPPNSDLNPFIGGGSLYAVRDDGTVSRTPSAVVPHDQVPAFDDGGVLVYRFELSHRLGDGGVEYDPSGLIVVETHQVTSASEPVEVHYLDQCPGSPSGGPYNSGWY